MNRIILIGKNKDFPRFTPRQARKPASNWWREAIVETLTVVGGLAVFGAVAFFFMVL